jgi:hypothetical protein
MRTVYGDAFRGWLYVDDRAFKVLHDDHAEAVRIRDAVLTDTVRIDTDVGLQLHAGKTQLWDTEVQVEHLGFLTEPQGMLPALLRGGFPDAYVEAVAQVPGGAFLRAQAMALYVMPKFLWGAPLAALPAAGKEDRVMEVVLKTRCTWWCKGRWFIDNLNLHPRLMMAIRILGSTFTVNLSTAVRRAREIAAAELGLAIFAQTEQGVQLYDVSGLRVVAEVVDAAARKQRCEDRAGARRVFHANSELGRHVLRTAARAKLLQKVERSRADAEAASEVDIEANTGTKLRKWVAQMSVEDKRAFSVWRGGAAWTPSRRYWKNRPLEDQDAKVWCPCGQAVGSARHYFAECEFFAEVRAGISAEWGIPPAWWATQPRVTSKTGWVTFGAADTKDRRIELAIAASQMGIRIVRSLPGWFEDAGVMHIQGGCVRATAKNGGVRTAAEQCFVDASVGEGEVESAVGGVFPFYGCAGYRDDEAYS